MSSDDLRTRIAAVLDKHYPQTTGYHDELTDWCQCGMPRSHVVDVLIRELRSSGEVDFTYDHLNQSDSRVSISQSADLRTFSPTHHEETP